MLYLLNYVKCSELSRWSSCESLSGTSNLPWVLPLMILLTDIIQTHIICCLWTVTLGNHWFYIKAVLKSLPGVKHAHTKFYFAVSWFLVSQCAAQNDESLRWIVLSYNKRSLITEMLGSPDNIEVLRRMWGLPVWHRLSCSAHAFLPDMIAVGVVPETLAAGSQEMIWILLWQIIREPSWWHGKCSKCIINPN